MTYLTKAQYFDFDICDIHADIKNSYDEQLIEQLAQSMLDTGTLIYPLIVKKITLTSYELVSNELGYLAAQRAEQLDPRRGEMVAGYLIEEENVDEFTKQLLAQAALFDSIHATAPEVQPEPAKVLSFNVHRQAKLNREHPVIPIKQAKRVKEARTLNSYATPQIKEETAEQWAKEDTKDAPTKVNRKSRFGKLLQSAEEWSDSVNKFDKKVESCSKKVQKKLEEVAKTPTSKTLDLCLNLSENYDEWASNFDQMVQELDNTTK